ncbi:hypothetical protein LJB91_02360, partial [Bacteroidales bacterium OttesenSCG-928-L03]|nr:hypothetical protein [Bacteroidales bacterium OttesenSCG-928-L03]
GVTLQGDTLLIFPQFIPISILEQEGNQEGTYTFYYSSSPSGLDGSTCTGIAEFNVAFDKLDFTAQVAGASEKTSPQEVQACTSSVVEVSAYPLDGISGATIQAEFDWFHGPINTIPTDELGEGEAENAEWDPGLNFIGFNDIEFKFNTDGEPSETGTSHSLKEDLDEFRHLYPMATAVPTNDIENPALMNRMNYYINEGYLYLRHKTIPLALNSMARYFLTAIPTDSAYVVLGGSTIHYRDICYGPYQTLIQATGWGGDIVFGEVDEEGTPITEYPDTYENPDYVYTVRLPERDQKGNDLREQFVVPMLYVDEVHLAKVELIKVDGELVVADGDLTTGLPVDGVYIGVIDSLSPNQIDKTHTIKASYSWNGSSRTAGEYDLPTAWRIGGDYDTNRALESYPLTWNGYNYYIDDPDSNHDLILEGDPYPIGTEINGTPLDNNKIALEIPASGLPEEYVDLIEGEETARFQVGKEYLFMIKCTAYDSWSTSVTCDQYFYFQLKVLPDTVYWTGEISSEWNDDRNWAGAKDGTTPGFAPASDTKVVLPSNVTTYPVLRDLENEAALENATPYSEYDYNYNPNTASTLWFESGSLLGNQFYLNYDSVGLELQLNTFQWYGLSAPFRDMYSGDYDFFRLNPVTEMRMFNVTIPELGGNNLSWSNSFRSTTEALSPGQGFCLRVGRIYYPGLPKDGSGSNSGISPEIINTATFSFPKSDASYQRWNSKTKEKKVNQVDYLNEGGKDFYKHFVYEVTDNDTSKVPEGDVLLTLPLNRTGAGELVLVGNPFMAHLDFEEFYRVNQGVITPGYQIMAGPTNTAVYSLTATADSEGNLSNIVATEGLDLTSIAPMTTFMVTTRADYDGTEPKLYITKAMSVVPVAASEEGLRSSSAARSNALRILVNKGDHRAEAILYFNPTAFDEYRLIEDSRRVSLSEDAFSLNVFTIVDNIYLDINRMSRVPQSISIGITTANKGLTSIRIQGLESMPGTTKLFLKDAKEGVLKPIEDNDFEYVFNNVEGDQIGRFFLVSEECTSINEAQSGISISKSQGAIQVLSNNGSEIKEVSVYSVDGKLQIKEENTKRSDLSIPIPDNHSVVIVKVVTKECTSVKKILN